MPISLNNSGYSSWNNINKMRANLICSKSTLSKQTDKVKMDANKIESGVSVSISQAGKEKVNDIGNMNLIKAKDNAVVIDNPIRAAYEKYATLIRVDADGTETWEINSGYEDKFDAAVAEGIKRLGGRDNYNFWIRLSQKDPTFMGLTYSAEDTRNRLHNAGIQKGFFQVTVGGHTATQFLSEGKNAAAVYSKAYYDDQYYNFVKSGGICRDYKSGDVFRIGGKEYTVDNNGKLDVPYGEDIWDVEYPKTKVEEMKEG